MAGLRRGRGMSLMTIAKHYGIYPTSGVAASTPPTPPTPYLVDPQIGDTVEFKHQIHCVNGTVIQLLEEHEDYLQHRPANVGKRRWLVSKNYVSTKRAVVKVERPDDLPLFYTVTYVSYAKNHFRVVKRAGEEQTV